MAKLPADQCVYSHAPPWVSQFARRSRFNTKASSASGLKSASRPTVGSPGLAFCSLYNRTRHWIVTTQDVGGCPDCLQFLECHSEVVMTERSPTWYPFNAQKCMFVYVDEKFKLWFVCLRPWEAWWVRIKRSVGWPLKASLLNSQVVPTSRCLPRQPNNHLFLYLSIERVGFVNLQTLKIFNIEVDLQGRLKQHGWFWMFSCNVVLIRMRRDCQRFHVGSFKFSSIEKAVPFDSKEERSDLWNQMGSWWVWQPLQVQC